MPKFRGGSDDWLDEESDAVRKSGRKKKVDAKATSLPWEQANAVVAEVYPKQCRVRLDPDPDSGVEGETELLCSYRRADVIGSSGASDTMRDRTPVAVGDRVLARKTGSTDGIVEGVCARRNALVRPAPGKKEESKLQQVIAANVDTLLIVASVSEPEFSPGLIDRYLIAASAASIEPILCVTKIDLTAAGPPPWEIYRELGYAVRLVSGKRGDGVDELRAELHDKVVVFCGRSGVGKTSLLRSLLRSDVGRVGDISQATQKGKHTTTSAIMLRGPAGSRWIDTPGVREFGLSNVSPETLRDHFPELQGLNCPHSGCLHLDEDGCAARSLDRYPSYRRVFQSLLANEG